MIILNFIYCFVELNTLFILCNIFIDKKYGDLINGFTISLFSIINFLITQIYPNTLGTIFLVLFATIMCFILFQYKIKEIIFLSFIFFIVVGIISTITINIISLTSGLSSHELLNNSLIYLFGGIFNKLIPLVLVFSIRKYRKNNEIIEIQNIIIFFSLIIFLFIIIVAQYSLVLTIRDEKSRILSLLISLLLIIIFTIIVVILSKYNNLQKNSLTSQYNNNILALYKDYEINLIRNREELIMIKHDLKHHDQLFKTLILEKHYDKAISSINQLIEKTNSISSTVFSNNIVLDSIINNFITEYLNIKFTININTSLSLLDELDTCILFSNLLSNAAHSALKSDKKIIELIVLENENFYVIEVINSMEFEFIDINITSKRKNSNHGYGLKNIYSIIHKFKGNYHIDQTNHLFSFKILFPKGSIQNEKN
ncbi:GHKL domain-containing protein [Anaerorhabdus furcosa]|uniref:GHKL domain-containing protein n=1 Tax=Anaerorhabdus furcosa TaxID=118967 RepID=A0A1T4Q556_9FIRM|nr:GHKL domain-containing protein [Anaerorhabdus furcosa]SJZ98903.1 GHKL domain-containing protein [Anaerorhabdus furcosa]